MEGIYNEKIEIYKKDSVSISNYNNDKVVIDGSNIRNKDHIFYILNSSNITINNLDICNNNKGNTPSGIFVEGYGNNIEILNNKIYNIKSKRDAHGIAFYGSNSKKSLNNIIIKGNEVFNCELGSSESVVVNGNVENFKITNNIIHDNNNIGIDCIGFEKTSRKNDQARNGIISENLVYNISSKNNSSYKGDACADGIYIDGGKDIIIERNIVKNCDIGIEIASEHKNKVTDNIIVRNNLITNSNLYGLCFGGCTKRNGYASNCKFLNNTLYNNDTGIQIQQSKDNLIKNNIISNSKITLSGVKGTNIFNLNYGVDINGYINFINVDNNNFKLKDISIALNKGSFENTDYDNYVLDLEGKTYNNNKINLGCYQ